MKVSIITINRNNAEGLRKTIDSVTIQNYNDFEYIIVDGASTDDSLQVINDNFTFANEKELILSDEFPIEGFGEINGNKVRWISESDTGVYHAMNRGILMATGEYLLFLNSGDFFVAKNVLSEVFSKNPTADFLLGRCNVSENGIVIHTTNPPHRITFGHLYQSGLAHQSTFIKREMFEKFGLYREDFKYNADIEFWYRTIILAYCSTETFSTIVSDYNTDGISSKDAQTVAYKKEMKEIYAHPLLQLFIPDYNWFVFEKNEMKILYWVKSKKMLYGMLVKIYNLTCWWIKIRK